VKGMRANISDLHGKVVDLENKNTQMEKEVQNLNYHLNDDQRQHEAALNERDAMLRRMKSESQSLISELQTLLDTKRMLDAEIAIYRKMLEGEESRAGSRQMIMEQVLKTQSLQQNQGGAQNSSKTQSLKQQVKDALMAQSARQEGEMVSSEQVLDKQKEMETAQFQLKTTFQRSAKGNITIAECEPSGKFITLENTHRNKDEDISGCQIKRKLDGEREIVYTIPENTVVPAGGILKIYARDQGGENNPPVSLVFDAEPSWGVGVNVVTSLFNKEGDERATHTQKRTEVEKK